VVEHKLSKFTRQQPILALPVKGYLDAAPYVKSIWKKRTRALMNCKNSFGTLQQWIFNLWKLGWTVLHYDGLSSLHWIFVINKYTCTYSRTNARENIEDSNRLNYHFGDDGDHSITLLNWITALVNAGFKGVRSSRRQSSRRQTNTATTNSATRIGQLGDNLFPAFHYIF